MSDLSVKTLYAARHRTCQHVAFIGNTRQQATSAAFLLNATRAARGAWRVTTEVSDNDIAACMRGDRCEHCEVQG